MNIKVEFEELNHSIQPKLSKEVKSFSAGMGEVQVVKEYIGGVYFTTDETLTLDENNVLSVNVASEPEPDNTLPISSAAVATTVGNIEILLQTI